MNYNLKVLFIDASTGFYKFKRYPVGDFFGPIDLGLHLTGKYNTLNIGKGILAGSIFPGSNRLFVTGFSPCWRGFYISSMGGAGLVFDNLGIDLVSIMGKAPAPSMMYLNRNHGEEIEVQIDPFNLENVWEEGRGGVYNLMDFSLSHYGQRYENDPRVLATGPAAMVTDFGAIGSAPVKKGAVSFVDTWAGRGGFGSRLLQEHGIASIIYGGTFIDEDFRERNVADEWFKNKYNKKLAAKDFEATTKYRFDPNFDTGGTFGVNYASVGGRLLAFNYNSIYMTEEERVTIHENFIKNHYLKQFNEEIMSDKKNMKNCGEPCVAVCKKMFEGHKKDYEPYQAMGPLCGIFDQRAAEKLNHHADMNGFDAISVGGVLSWMMELLDKNLVTKEELGVSTVPVFSPDNFDVVTDSMHNAELGVELLDSILKQRGIIDLKEGARKFARRLSRQKGKSIIDSFVFISNGRKGWMVPNQYWTPGVLSPMAIMGKYYMYYGNDFVPPRTLGRMNAQRMIQELTMDNMGFCRFHRNWAEEMLPEIVESLFGMGEQLEKSTPMTASRINSRNASIFWESQRNIDFIHSFIRRQKEVEGTRHEELDNWLNLFDEDQHEAAYSYWFEISKGIHESLQEFK